MIVTQRTFVSTVAGTAQQSGYGDGQGTVSLFAGPQGLLVDAAGNNIYICDPVNSVIRKIVLLTSQVSRLAGQVSAVGGFLDGAGGSQALFKTPHSIVIDSVGNLYVSDSGNNRIRKIMVGTLQVSTVAGSGSSVPFVDNVSGTVATLNSPSGLVLDGGGGILYFCDSANNLIRKVVIATGIVSSVAGSGLASPFSDGQNNVASFNQPKGIAFDGQSNLYVADTLNHRIRRISLTSGMVTTISGSGSQGLVDGQAASYKSPQGIVYSASDSSLYIADTGNNRIRKLVINTGVVSTIAGSGASAGFSNSIFGTSAIFNGPTGISVDSNGIIYLSDTNNYLVRRVVTCQSSLPYDEATQSCVCDKGYQPVGDGTCNQCLESYYKSSTGNNQCQKCPQYYTSSADRYTCVACPNYASQCNSTYLLCKDGYQRSSTGLSCEIATSAAITDPILKFITTNLSAVILSVLGLMLVGSVYILYRRWRTEKLIEKKIQLERLRKRRVRPSITSGSSADPRVAARERTKYLALAQALGPAAEQGLSIPGFLGFTFNKDFKITKFLAQGGGGKIYLGTASDPVVAQYGSQVIIKQLLKDPQSQKEKDCFFQEISVMYMLREHLNIAKLAAYSVDPYSMVVKYYPIGSLEDWAKDRKNIKSKSVLLGFVRDISEGLRYMHKYGLAHCDMKPANCLMDTDHYGNVFCVLNDFGLTRVVNRAVLKVQAFHAAEVNGASINYAAPELLYNLRKGEITKDPFVTDIYALGVIIYRLISQRQPWKRELAKMAMSKALKDAREAAAKAAQSDMPKLRPRNPVPTAEPASPRTADPAIAGQQSVDSSNQQGSRSPPVARSSTPMGFNKTKIAPMPTEANSNNNQATTFDSDKKTKVDI